MRVPSSASTTTIPTTAASLRIEKLGTLWEVVSASASDNGTAFMSRCVP